MTLLTCPADDADSPQITPEIAISFIKVLKSKSHQNIQ